MVNIGSVQVYTIVVLLRIVSRYESFILKWVRFHNTGLYRLFYLAVKFFER